MSHAIYNGKAIVVFTSDETLVIPRNCDHKDALYGTHVHEFTHVESFAKTLKNIKMNPDNSQYYPPQQFKRKILVVCDSQPPDTMNKNVLFIELKDNPKIHSINIM